MVVLVAADRMVTSRRTLPPRWGFCFYFSATQALPAWATLFRAFGAGTARRKTLPVKNNKAILCRNQLAKPFFVLMYPPGLKRNVTYFTIGRDSDQKPCAAPTGLIFMFTFFPGFRCAPLLQLTLQDRLWAKLWSRLRRSGSSLYYTFPTT